MNGKLIRTMTILLAVLAAAAFIGPSMAADGSTGEDKPQTRCPVMGGEINKAVFADHDGKRVYFCCAACIPRFEEDPAGFIAKMEKDGIVLDRTPGADAGKPVPDKGQETGPTGDDDHGHDHGGEHGRDQVPDPDHDHGHDHDHA